MNDLWAYGNRLTSLIINMLYYLQPTVQVSALLITPTRGHSSWNTTSGGRGSSLNLGFIRKLAAVDARGEERKGVCQTQLCPLVFFDALLKTALMGNDLLVNFVTQMTKKSAINMKTRTQLSLLPTQVITFLLAKDREGFKSHLHREKQQHR